MKTLSDVLARLQSEQAALPQARATADAATALANQKLRDELEAQIKAASDALIASRAAEDSDYADEIAVIEAAIPIVAAAAPVAAPVAATAPVAASA